MNMKNYKGDLLGAGVDLVYAFIFIGILLGAGVVALASFGTTQTGSALAAINNATVGLVNVSLQMPTVGTIGGIGLIIIVLFTALGGTYMYMKK